MKKSVVLFRHLSLVFFVCLSLFAAGQVPEPNTILFGRGTYPGDDSSYAMIRSSGFTTMMLSSFYMEMSIRVMTEAGP